ncbi:hypothetical protein CJ20_043 [Escherichia phage CJ20]|nr:hypothetical protein CJ20_043 [Escherichia phage CJ20]
MLDVREYFNFIINHHLSSCVWRYYKSHILKQKGPKAFYLNRSCSNILIACRRPASVLTVIITSPPVTTISSFDSCSVISESYSFIGVSSKYLNSSPKIRPVPLRLWKENPVPSIVLNSVTTFASILVTENSLVVTKSMIEVPCWFKMLPGIPTCLRKPSKSLM